MSKLTQSTILWAMMPMLLWGQSPPSCTFDLFLQQLPSDVLEQLDAQYQQAIAQSHTAQWRGEEMVIDIPVVVHIVWNKAEENLTDQRIQSQIEVLNRDFGQVAESIRPVFAQAITHPNLKFHLEQIIRVPTQRAFALEYDWETLTLRYPDAVKHSAEGGSDAWPTNRYLNIWVCAIANDQLLGYAYPPAGLDGWPEDDQLPGPEEDGIVINYKAFGADPPPFIDRNGREIPMHGHTTTHEVGHYLGLRHPWGIFHPQTPGCALDDGLKDTPLTEGPAHGHCDFEHNSCLDQPVDLPDMIENFMDYADESCRTAFTRQQAGIMRYVLAQYRPLLRQSTLTQAKRGKLQVFPNPSGGLVYCSSQQAGKEAEIQVFNSHSQRLAAPVQSFQQDGKRYFQVDMNHLANGLYLIQVKGERELLSGRVLLIR